MRKPQLMTILLAVCSPAVAALAELPGMAAGAPQELLHWQKLMGRWSTTEESLKQDGSGWQPSKGADWEFFWSFDGWGVQDNYVSPPAAEPVDDESKRQRGTNLRIYNPVEDKWIMTWLTITSSKPQTFTARSTDDEIIMRNDNINPQGYHSRITFFDVTPTTFEWKLEWSKDEDSWFEVYKIHGTRNPD